MTITIYELFGMIKDGKAPKKFIYDNQLFILDEEDNVYRSHLGYRFGAMYQLDIKLNDEVEILEEEKKTKSLENKPIEEEKKIPEKLGSIKYCEDQATFLIHHKVDEIIEYLHYFKSKGDK